MCNSGEHLHSSRRLFSRRVLFESCLTVFTTCHNQRILDKGYDQVIDREERLRTPETIIVANRYINSSSPDILDHSHQQYHHLLICRCPRVPPHLPIVLFILHVVNGFVSYNISIPPTLTLTSQRNKLSLTASLSLSIMLHLHTHPTHTQ